MEYIQYIKCFFWIFCTWVRWTVLAARPVWNGTIMYEVENNEDTTWLFVLLDGTKIRTWMSWTPTLRKENCHSYVIEHLQWIDRRCGDSVSEWESVVDCICIVQHSSNRTLCTIYALCIPPPLPPLPQWYRYLLITRQAVFVIGE